MRKSHSEIEQTIRTAYINLRAERGAEVNLVRLRNELGDICRHDVDAVLVQMACRGTDTTLAPESNQKTLTEMDRDMAVWMGGQWKHLLLIEG